MLKARLIQLGQTIRKTHDLASLSVALQAADAQWRWDASELDDLRDAGVMNRYPGFDTSEQEMQDLMELSARLRQALLNELGMSP